MASFAPADESPSEDVAARNARRLAEAKQLRAITTSLDMEATLYRQLFPELFVDGLDGLAARDSTLGLDYLRASRPVLELPFDSAPGGALRFVQDQRSGVLGAVVWDCGEAMARFLVAEPALVRGRAVLDLGTGTGVAGVAAAALAGAGLTLLSDIEACRDVAERSLAANATALEAAAGACSFLAFDWTAPELPEEFDALLASSRPVLLVSDCLYQFQLLKPLLALLRRLLTPEMILIWTYKVGLGFGFGLGSG
mmetsp:Transcript_33220/g.105059  ORF Transcript_33220/g.105059 Transcript_33220/m.105059 type:complete len:254 (-) Transcript_33220:15-776(-)